MKGGPERIGARWDVDDTAERTLVRAAGLVMTPAAWNIPGTATAATEGRLLTTWMGCAFASGLRGLRCLANL